MKSINVFIMFIMIFMMSTVAFATKPVQLPCGNCPVDNSIDNSVSNIANGGHAVATGGISNATAQGGAGGAGGNATGGNSTVGPVGSVGNVGHASKVENFSPEANANSTNLNTNANTNLINTTDVNSNLQGQQQGQLQGQGQGQQQGIQDSGNSNQTQSQGIHDSGNSNQSQSVVDSGNSNQSQSVSDSGNASQSQSVNDSGNSSSKSVQGQTAHNAGNSQNITIQNPRQPKMVPSMANFVPMPTSPCMATIGGAGAGAGFGFSISGSYINTNCEIQEAAKTMLMIGQYAAAVEIACTGKHAASATICQDIAEDNAAVAKAVKSNPVSSGHTSISTLENNDNTLRARSWTGFSSLPH